MYLFPKKSGGIYIWCLMFESFVKNCYCTEQRHPSKITRRSQWQMATRADVCEHEQHIKLSESFSIYAQVIAHFDTNDLGTFGPELLNFCVIVEEEVCAF